MERLVIFSSHPKSSPYVVIVFCSLGTIALNAFVFQARYWPKCFYYPGADLLELQYDSQFHIVLKGSFTVRGLVLRIGVKSHEQ